MSKVWDRVVEDLQTYSENKTEQKTFWQKVKDFLSSGCTSDCNQGRSCDCCGTINHDNRY